VKLILLLALRSFILYFVVAIIIVLIVTNIIYKSFSIYLAAVVGILLLYYMIWLFYTLFSKKNRALFVSKHFTFGDENILVKFPNLEQVIKWEAFNAWERIAGFYLLKFLNGKLIIIPKSDIPDSEIPIFEDLLSQKIDKILMVAKY
jgi:hypothetical protein